jgi:tryptophan-rich sensory protein
MLTFPHIALILGQLSAASANLLALTTTVAAWGLTLKDVDERAALLTVPYFGE